MWTAEGFSIDPDQAPCGVAMMGDDGRLLALNEPLISLLELEHAALPGCRVDDILSPSARVIMQMVMMPMLKLQGHVQEMTLVLRGRDGKDIHVLACGKRWIQEGTAINQCVFVPVEQRRKVEEQLMQSWRVTEQVPGVLFQLEIEPGGQARFLHITDNVTKLTGLSPSRLRQDARPFIDMLLPADRDKALALFQASLPEGRVHVEELRYQARHARKEAWCELRFLPRSMPDGRTHWNGYVCDITRQKALEAHLRETDKLRVTATLAAGVAHDFNNLLGSIMGLAELCQAAAQEGTRLHTNLGNIVGTGRKAAVLVRQMLAYARQMPHRCEPLCLNALLHRTRPLLEVGLPSEVTLAIRSEGEAPILGDPVELEQVLLNLVNNAAYAMKDRGGAITLRTALAPATGNPLRCDAVYLVVEDEGSGIDPEDLPNIFQPFFTTKPVGEGTGLGLAAAYGIVQSHQGHIEVRSAPGGGTCFDIWLPVQPLGRGTGTQA